jgi:hypothetical protein
MAFDKIFMSQIGQVPEPLDLEILKIMSNINQPMTTQEIFKLSKVAITSRDVSLEFGKNLKKKGLVEIDRKERKPGIAQECAYWKLTQKGIDFIKSGKTELPEYEIEDEPKMTDEKNKTDAPAVDDNITGKDEYEIPAFLRKGANKTIVAQTKSLKDNVFNYVLLHNQATSMQILDAFNDERENASKRIWELVNQGALKKEDGLIKLGPNANKRLAKAKTNLDSFKLIDTQDVVGLSTANSNTNAVHEQAEKVSKKTDAVLNATQVFVDNFNGKTEQELKAEHRAEKPSSSVPVLLAAPAKSGDFRVAYTNDGCLMLLGLQIMPIELNAAQTNDLIDFISETITPIGVAI